MAIKTRTLITDGQEAVDDLTGPMGIQLVRGSSRDLPRRGHGAPSLLFALDTTVLEVSFPTESVRGLLDRANLAVVPQGVTPLLKAKGALVQLLVLELSPAVRAYACSDYPEVDSERLEQVLKVPRVLSRTTWVHELLHRYMFERTVCERRDNVATRFLEAELVKELYFLCRADEAKAQRSSLVHEKSPLIARALTHLEQHLFEKLSTAALAKDVGTSESTLLRAFKRELGQAPSEYVRTRRLDEALLLLKAHRYSVSEVAEKVGYESAAAFSHAFRRRFKLEPSRLRRDS